MSNITARLAISEAAKTRVAALALGEPVTNVCAGDGNPQRYAYFVKYLKRSRKNRWGIIHTDHWAKCTDRKGGFWNTDIKVIYPGHLPPDTCAELFAPIWASEHQP